MSDPLLTTLCGICRAVPTKYKCPRCGVRYCSVECNRRHRTRAGCSGIRDVTAYVPRSRLCTPAGIDHDYNFLHSIETARARAEKQIVEERRLMQSADLRPRVLGEDEPTTNNRQKQNKSPRPMVQMQWHGDDLRFLPIVNKRPDSLAAAMSRGSGRPNKKVLALCQREGVTMLSVPQGLVRHRENSTTVATIFGKGAGSNGPKELHLQWQVEWMVYEDGLAAKPTRILRPQLDDVPIYRGYGRTMAWLLHQTGSRRVDARVVKEVVVDDDDGDGEDENDEQNQGTSILDLRLRSQTTRHSAATGDHTVAGFFLTYSFQDYETAAWTNETSRGADLKEEEQEDADVLAAKRSFRFFLLRPQLPGQVAADQPRGTKQLIPIEATDTLATALRGRTVLEFPTIYVLPADAAPTLPPGHVLGSAVRQTVDLDLDRPAPPSKGKRTARESTAAQGQGQGGPKRRRTSIHNRLVVKGSDDAEADTEDSDDQEEGQVGVSLDDSETSSSGTSSSEDGEEDEDEEDDEDDDNDNAEEEEDGEIVEDNGLPLLQGLNANKSKLVVYDSWSEDEGE